MSRSTVWVPSLWKDTFEEMLNDNDELVCGDQWGLNFSYSHTDKVTQEERKRGWKVDSYNAHADFKCGSCRKVWPSARVVVLFRYRLRGARGTVIMRPFGQACRRCQDNKFYLPGFSSEEIECALLRLFAKIREKCYRVKERKDGGDSRPNVRLTKPHEKDLCQACSMGICEEKDKRKRERETETDRLCVDWLRCS